MEKSDKVFLTIICAALAALILAAAIMLPAKAIDNRNANTYETTGKIISVGDSGIRFEWSDAYGETRVNRYTVDTTSDQLKIGDTVQLEIVYNKCSKVYL